MEQFCFLDVAIWFNAGVDDDGWLSSESSLGIGEGGVGGRPKAKISSKFALIFENSID